MATAEPPLGARGGRHHGPPPALPRADPASSEGSWTGAVQVGGLTVATSWLGNLGPSSCHRSSPPWTCRPWPAASSTLIPTAPAPRGAVRPTGYLGQCRSSTSTRSPWRTLRPCREVNRSGPTLEACYLIPTLKDCLLNSVAGLVPSRGHGRPQKLQQVSEVNRQRGLECQSIPTHGMLKGQMGCVQERPVQRHAIG